MGLKETFRKQGGLGLIKQYLKGGALFTALGEFVLLGKSRTALEILRLSASLKIKQKLCRKYSKSLDMFDSSFDEHIEHCFSNKVWICWFQGIEAAPDIVKKCYTSVKENMPEKDIVILTDENIKDYVQFPDYINEKINRGVIKGAHLSDLIRLELLIRYGGIWIDSTVYVSDSNIPKYMTETDLFMFQTLKPGRDGHSSVISNWYIAASTNNKLLMATRYLLYEYWRKNDDIVDYFIFHDFFQMVIERYPGEWNKVVPSSNSTPHILLLRLFEPYDEGLWNAIKTQTPIHKLTYKFDDEKTQIENTYYQRILM